MLALIFAQILGNSLAIFIFFLILLSIAYSALFVLYANGWRNLNLFPFKHQYSGSTKVSVIIPARNEEQHIKKCIDGILAQQYTGWYEVIVVNDESTDATLAILKTYGDLITIINLADEIKRNIVLNAYKKKAIELAVQRAKGDLIITTDADTIRGANWIDSFVQCYETGKYKIIAGPVNYVKEKSVLHFFQIIDFITMQGITAASLFYHFNSTCNGANLAYAKSAFIEVKGFAGIDDIASGDDMLLLHKIEQKYPQGSFYLKSEEAMVSTYAMGSLRDFLSQRIRWASKAKHYSDKRVTAVLASVFLYNILIGAMIALTCCGSFSVIGCVLLLAVKIGMELSLVQPVTTFFQQKSLLIWHVLLQPFHIIYIIVCGFLGQISQFDWKGRKVH
jgi:cellulose synthase/poly-beta-1,6-N-acetylglucosamine synthase-like glycosyltransferase